MASQTLGRSHGAGEGDGPKNMELPGSKNMVDFAFHVDMEFYQTK